MLRISERCGLYKGILFVKLIYVLKELWNESVCLDEGGSAGGMEFPKPEDKLIAFG